MTTKPYLSKTIWLNLVMGVLVALGPMFAPASAWAAWVQSNVSTIGMVWSVLAILVRLVTKGRISLQD